MENPVQFQDKNQISAKLEMKDKEKENRVKPMRYNPKLIILRTDNTQVKVVKSSINFYCLVFFTKN